MFKITLLIKIEWFPLLFNWNLCFRRCSRSATLVPSAPLPPLKYWIVERERWKRIRWHTCRGAFGVVCPATFWSIEVDLDNLFHWVAFLLARVRRQSRLRGCASVSACSYSCKPGEAKCLWELQNNVSAQCESSTFTWPNARHRIFQWIFVEGLELINGWIDAYRHAESSRGKV